MAAFEVKVVRVDSVEKHPMADRLTINHIGGYRCITNLTDAGEPRYAAGDLAVYVPENAILPQSVMRQYGYWKTHDREGNPLPEDQQTGMLAGSKGDRVRPLKLRSVYSEGLLLKVKTDTSSVEEPGFRYYVTNGDTDLYVELGDDVAVFFGITKYEPPIPAGMEGACFYVDGLPKFDVEAYEKYPNVFVPGETVVATEKLHGTFTGFSYFPDRKNEFGEKSPHGVLVYSKGLANKGFAFELTPANDGNLYVQRYRSLFESIGSMSVWEAIIALNMPVHLFGETYGRGVQDLHYGKPNPAFALFDVYLGEWGRGRYLNSSEVLALAMTMNLPTVPVAYTGPFDVAALEAARDGKDLLSGTNIREGIVIRPVVERRDPMLGRVCLKMVSPAYKLRKGAGEEIQ